MYRDTDRLGQTLSSEGSIASRKATHFGSDHLGAVFCGLGRRLGWLSARLPNHVVRALFPHVVEIDNVVGCLGLDLHT